MLFSISVLLLLGMSLGALCKKLHLPALTGMLITGIFLGPYALDLIDASILSVSADLRRIALIIILIRAGLSLNLDDLKKVGRPAILMCFVPACFEMAGMILLAPKLLGISLLDAAILPNMVKLMEEGYGTKKGIPQLILAGASVDDVFVIVVFTAFTSLAAGDSVSIRSFVNIPISIFLGIISGLGIGLLLSVFFHRIHMRDTAKVIIFLCISFLLVTLEDHCANVIPFASLIAVMTIGVSLQQKNQALSLRLSLKFNKLWVGAEIILFVLVGATVDLRYLKSAGGTAVLLLLLVLLFRMSGVFLCLAGTDLTKKERLFCMIAYTPKATVQAAIGGIPLALGLSCGNLVLTVAVVSILLTAPLGAFCIENSYQKLLTH